VLSGDIRIVTISVAATDFFALTSRSDYKTHTPSARAPKGRRGRRFPRPTDKEIFIGLREVYSGLRVYYAFRALTPRAPKLPSFFRLDNFSPKYWKSLDVFFSAYFTYIFPS
jgi:hypothetical protein